MTGTVDWDGGNITLALYADDFSVELGGVGFSTGNSEFCLEAKKVRIYGIPFTIEGCLTLDPNLSARNVTIGGNVTICLLESDPCDELDWVNNYADWVVTSCQPCLPGVGLTGTIP